VAAKKLEESSWFFFCPVKRRCFVTTLITRGTIPVLFFHELLSVSQGAEANSLRIKPFCSEPPSVCETIFTSPNTKSIKDVTNEGTEEKEKEVFLILFV
jgi:hypothetical protein